MFMSVSSLSLSDRRYASVGAAPDAEQSPVETCSATAAELRCS